MTKSTDNESLRDVFHFEMEGTLPKPGPIGRSVRLVMGVLITKLIIDWFTIIDSSDFTNPFILFWVAFSVALVPYVVNIGFGVNFGAIPRYLLLGLWLLAAVTGYVTTGVLKSEILWMVVEVTQIYIYGHLGISFLLSAILATPGCEMRAVPQLLGKLSGTSSKEHYCPGFIENVDQWELSQTQGKANDD